MPGHHLGTCPERPSTSEHVRGRAQTKQFYLVRIETRVAVSFSLSKYFYIIERHLVLEIRQVKIRFRFCFEDQTMTEGGSYSLKDPDWP